TADERAGRGASRWGERVHDVSEVEEGYGQDSTCCARCVSLGESSLNFARTRAYICRGRPSWRQSNAGSVIRTHHVVASMRQASAATSSATDACLLGRATGWY